MPIRTEGGPIKRQPGMRPDAPVDSSGALQSWLQSASATDRARYDLELRLVNGEIDLNTVNRLLNQIPGNEGIGWVRDPNNNGYKLIRDKKLQFRDNAIGMGAAVGGGIAGGYLTGALNAAGAPGAAAATQAAPAAATGAGLPSMALPIGSPASVLGPGGAATAAQVGSFVPPALAATGTAAATGAGGNATMAALLKALGGGGGASSYIPALIGAGSNIAGALLNRGQGERELNPAALRAIGSLGMGMAQRVESPIASRLPNVGGRDGRPTLRQAWEGMPGLTTGAGHAPPLSEFMAERLDPTLSRRRPQVQALGQLIPSLFRGRR